MGTKSGIDLKRDVLSVHKTFHRDGKGNRTINWYVSDAKEVEFLTDKSTERLQKKLTPGKVIRFTAVNAADEQIISLHERGMKVVHANWHTLGIPKNTEPEDICLLTARAPDKLFREFVPNRTMAQLRSELSLRNAVLDLLNDARRKIAQQARNNGIADVKAAKAHPAYQPFFDEVNTIGDKLQAIGDDGEPLSYDEKVNETAAKIPECLLFNEVAGIKGKTFITAASIVAYAGGIGRFDDVASFWAYFGQSVVDGKAPKRQAGKVANWSQQGRVALWRMADSIIKNGDPRWREFYARAKAAEMAVHLEKHPGCPTPEGHCGARARRKMTKEIMKEFYIKATGQEFRESLSV